MTPMDEIAQDSSVLADAVGLVAGAEDLGVRMRLIGGVAVALHSPSTHRAPFRRVYDDIDLVVERRDRRHLDRAMGAGGYEADAAFNSLNGHDRRTYYSASGRKVDVFIGEFAMCHRLEFAGRLDEDTPTLPLADLFLSKAQIRELTDKDAYDLIALLLDHRSADGDSESIGVTRVQAVCGGDWGWWRTVSDSLDELDRRCGVDPALSGVRTRAEAAIGEVRGVLAAAPKTQKWKLRSRLGDRKVWYTLPEEPEDRADL